MNADETPLPDESSCANCDGPNSADYIVQCDRCYAWWHMTCAGVTDSVEDRSWSCSKCVHVTSDAESVKSMSTTKSKRMLLVLKKLLEEHEMKVKQLKDQQKLESFESVDEAARVIQEVRAIHAKGGFQHTSFPVEQFRSAEQSWREGRTRSALSGFAEPG